MKYTKEQLEKIDFGKFGHNKWTAQRIGAAVALFNGDDCVAVCWRGEWHYETMSLEDTYKSQTVAGSFDTFVKSELERIEKDDVPVYPGDLITCECRGVKFGVEVKWVKR